MISTDMAESTSSSPLLFPLPEQTVHTVGDIFVTAHPMINQTIRGESDVAAELNKTVLTDGPIFDSVEDAVFGIMVFPLGVIAVYIILGLLGNSLVFYVFFVRWKRNKTSVFIIALALLDLFNCSINMPIEIFILSKPISFDFNIFCKISRYLSYVTTASYSFVLVAVAFDRYLLVCRPLKRMTLGKRYAIRTCNAAVLLGVITEWPSVFIYGTFSFEIPVHVAVNGTETVVEGRTCLVTNYHLYVDTAVTYAFQGFLFTGHVVIFSALTIMYIMIGRRLYISSHSDIDSKGPKTRMLKKSLVSAITGSVCCGGKSKSLSNDALPYSRNKRPSNASVVTSSKESQNSKAVELSNGKPKRGTISRSLSNIHLQLESESPSQESSVDKTEVNTEFVQGRKTNAAGKVIHKGSIRPYSHPGTNSKYQFSDVTPSTSNISFPRSVSMDHGQVFSISQCVERPKTADIKEISLRRNTLIMRMVTFTFMLSYLPFLIIVTLRYSNPDIPAKLGQTEKIVYHIFLRSYFFNSITRPFIYAIMNEDYRKNVLKIFFKE